NDEAPLIAEPWICREIINQHMYSTSMLTIFPIQDIISIDGKLRWSEIDKERINVPSDEKNKWKYRMILPLEDLINSTDFNEEVSEMINRSGRNTKV
ncbi:MAG: 4-alpha-glucanotransferase, partial [Prolixibacteraceae bacterium]|nr:4-alpha-glucanotransferase [Prolixibacteraceae bacterium]